MFDALTFLDRDGNLQPWLAQSWEPDGELNWIVHLRKDVRFSNGEPLMADDVAKNLKYLISPDGMTERAAPFMRFIEDIVVVDDFTVRLQTSTPDPVLPQKLSLIRIAALPDDAPFSRDALIQAALGSGPYKLNTWATTFADFDAVPDAWRRAPTLTLRALSIPDSSARRVAIITGAADIAFAAFSFDDLDDPNRPYNLEPDDIPAVVALAFNTTKDTPLRDPRVREALSYAVRIKDIVDVLFAGQAAPASQPARKEFIGYNPNLKPIPYDPDRARVLLKDAGYEDGFSFDMSLTSGAAVWDQFFQLLAADLAKVNIHVTINMVTPSLWAEQLFTTGVENEAYGTALFAPTFDALDSLRLNMCSWKANTYCDPVAQKLHDRAREASSLQERIELTRQLMTRSREMHQAMYLYESVGLVGYSKRITGLRSDFGFLRYELMTVTD
jgi:peptide/nickel transport system substrate-binding protein